MHIFLFFFTCFNKHTHTHVPTYVHNSCYLLLIKNKVDQVYVYFQIVVYGVVWHTIEERIYLAAAPRRAYLAVIIIMRKRIGKPDLDIY